LFTEEITETCHTEYILKLHIFVLF